jgi:hypothetical protein
MGELDFAGNGANDVSFNKENTGNDNSSMSEGGPIMFPSEDQGRSATVPSSNSKMSTDSPIEFTGNN